MFFTGFSSPFISIFLAIVLPWALVVFGKDTGRQIISESKIIFHLEKDRVEKTVAHETFSFPTTEKEPAGRPFLVFIEPGETCFIFCDEKPKHAHPVSNPGIISQPVNGSGNRAPPQMFTI